MNTIKAVEKREDMTLLMGMSNLGAVAPDGRIYDKVPKRYQGKALFIYIYNEKENPRVPHFHFSPYPWNEIDDLKDMYGGKNMNPDTIKHSEKSKLNWLQGCIRLDKVDYDEHANWHRTLNTVEERDSMAEILKSESDRFSPERGRFLTYWEVLVKEWNKGVIWNKKFIVKVRYDKQGKAIQPDYSKLEVVPFKLK